MHNKNEVTMTAAQSYLPMLSPDTGLAEYLQQIQQFPMLEAEEEQALAVRLHEEGDIEAAHTLVTSHLRLVAKIATGFRGYGLPLMDLIAEGNIGLMQAVKKFDYTKGFRLSTYAMWWIRASMQEFILKSWSLVKIGTTASQKKLFFNLKRLKSKLQLISDKALPPAEVEYIAKELDVDARDVMEMDQRLSQADSSLNDPITVNDQHIEYIELLEDEDDNQEVIYADAEEHHTRQHMLLTAMESLNDREQDIIQSRRLKDAPDTLDVLSKRYGVSCERIRQIEARAMQKLEEAVKA